MSYNMKGKNMKKISVTEKTTNEIKSDILSGVYKEGDKYLSENEVCDKFKVSRTTVREAMKILQATGFLELKPGKGAFVAACDESKVNKKAVECIFSKEDDFLELSEFRLGIEPIVAKYAAERATEDEIFKLYGILAFFEKAYKNNDISGMIDADEKFHNCIAACAHNQVYIRIYKHLSEASKECKRNLFSVENNGKAAVLEHKKIADAIANHDSQKSRIAMEKHIENVMNNIKNIASKKG